MYLLSYFKKEAEQFFLAESEDGLHWKERNGGLPQHVSGVGTGSIRDPFLLQDNSGRYHLIWTDGWGSRSIGYASSADLEHWEDERLIALMEHLPQTQNVWAPEAYYDKSCDAYRIVWSSTVGEGPRDHRIWSVTTRDFKTFSPAALFFDPGYNVIDASIMELDSEYLMFFKDERGTNEPGTDFKAIRSCSISAQPGGAVSFGHISELLTPPLTEGPTLYALTENHDSGYKWIMLADGFQDATYTVMGSRDLKQWEPVPADQVVLPTGLRHASVLALA
ncbi:glycoside hydrolase family 43 protein [Paenibacillus lemnae]|uniref:Glycoside hydrolase family 43 protein n=1 Tax=Paenibacillus lemnae TaxID=1330551 RepID=A0A848M7Y0_PAELE|nr:glycoside hydrolase family 43 protein [Paenibacillus lemnae]NMO97127.1 glycoside hydrolase family 43 protein [Paenibacillus lemnae]